MASEGLPGFPRTARYALLASLYLSGCPQLPVLKRPAPRWGVSLLSEVCPHRRLPFCTWALSRDSAMTGTPEPDRSREDREAQRWAESLPVGLFDVVLQRRDDRRAWRPCPGERLDRTQRQCFARYRWQHAIDARPRVRLCGRPRSFRPRARRRTGASSATSGSDPGSEPEPKHKRSRALRSGASAGRHQRLPWTATKRSKAPVRTTRIFEQERHALTITTPSRSLDRVDDLLRVGAR